MKYPYKIEICTNGKWQHFEYESNKKRAMMTAKRLMMVTGIEKVAIHVEKS